MPLEAGVTDALFIGAFVTFISVMLGFAFLYGRSLASSACDVPDETTETSNQDDRRSIPA